MEEPKFLTKEGLSHFCGVTGAALKRFRLKYNSIDMYTKSRYLFIVYEYLVEGKHSRHDYEHACFALYQNLDALVEFEGLSQDDKNAMIVGKRRRQRIIKRTLPEEWKTFRQLQRAAAKE